MSLYTDTTQSIGQQGRDDATPQLTSRPGNDSDATPRVGAQLDTDQKDDGTRKRSLFSFGKKKKEQLSASEKATAAASTAPTDQAFAAPVSPGRGLSSSPRLASPAGSQIFERDVDTMEILPQSPANAGIPSHIRTENHIPPVLDASSEAITDTRLDPDSVEIITHAQHLPASVTVTGGPQSTQPSLEQLAASWAEEFGSTGDRELDGASIYNSLDNADVRRLSFISFADVVQAEHAVAPNASRDSVTIAGLTSLSVNRSPSPVLSPMSSPGEVGTSPPTSNPGSIKGFELSPKRKPVGSPIPSQHAGNGDLNVETMTQALRRTASTDLSGARSLPISPIEGPSR
ncbi:conserved hypothetical protein [Verticillium alfalfae VaMs.102]|uniref:Uncharacterized protein n=1 Tax=Verticillium alfalfae (strain VaMs.102 / ATCC MYA-4576 / FGSC 10136) TaxID=526221 RepID=C9S639_VERA1|nr:conserved hypothetical protein [Verticillium alfalfae VaMs.102]EEY14378.1 conserved hypothetical protein [Verticillium alfalfae VaMs.102]